MPQFVHHDLRLLNPRFDSPLLSDADSGSDEALERWCTYVLTGIRDELQKVSRLANYDNLKSEVLLPTIAFAREREHITAQEAAVLAITVKTGVVKAGDLEPAMAGLNPNQRSYQMRKLIDSGMLQPVTAGARQYTIGFNHNLLLRGVVQALRSRGFITDALAAG